MRASLETLVLRWEEVLHAFTSPYYTVEKPMDATKVLEQCIAELKAVLSVGVHKTASRSESWEGLWQATHSMYS